MDSDDLFENINIGEVCRACLAKCGHYKFLYEKEEIKNKTLGDVFYDVVKIQINTNETPNRICQPCSYDLVNAYNFIQKSQENNERLNQLLSKHKIKQSDSLLEYITPHDQNISDTFQIKVEKETLDDYDNSMVMDYNNSSVNSLGSERSDYELQAYKKDECKLQCYECDFTCHSNIQMENHQKDHTSRTKLTSSEQLEKLISLLQEQPLLAGGKSAIIDSPKKIHYEKWEKIATELNKFGPLTRTAKEWQRVWIHYKSKLKRKSAVTPLDSGSIDNLNLIRKDKKKKKIVDKNEIYTTNEDSYENQYETSYLSPNEEVDNTENMPPTEREVAYDGTPWFASSNIPSNSFNKESFTCLENETENFNEILEALNKIERVMLKGYDLNRQMFELKKKKSLEASELHSLKTQLAKRKIAWLDVQLRNEAPFKKNEKIEKTENFETNKNRKNEKIIQFIELYKHKEILWNINLPMYRRNDIKEKAYESIASEMSMSVNEVKKKIKSIRTTYIAERNKVEKSKKSGSAESVYKPTLFWYNKLSFLNPSIIQRRTLDNTNKDSSTSKNEINQMSSLSNFGSESDALLQPLDYEAIESEVTSSVRRKRHLEQISEFDLSLDKIIQK